ncbi:MAG: hypothetical protein K8S23_16440 [Candidatus Cloacimonetes bacterium]|nr:hypothetical protein [Candidatus Cloacimonadota bacterium]
MKQFIVIFFLIACCLNGEVLSKENSFLQPDSLYIHLFDTQGCIVDSYSMISIRYHNNQGTLYSYGLGSLTANYKKNNNKRTDLLRKGVLNKNNIDSIIKILFENNIIEIENSQTNPNCRTHSSADGSGILSIVIKKENRSFNKIIKYPKPVRYEKTLNKKFIKLYNQLQFLSLELSTNIQFSELLQLFDKPQLADVEIRNHIFQSFTEHSICEIDKKNEIINLKREFFKRENNNKSFDHPIKDILQALYKSNNQEYYTFIDSIIISTQAGDSIYQNIFNYVRIINHKDKMKNEYMKKCLPIELNNTDVKAACFLVRQKDNSGLQVLLNYLDKDDIDYVFYVAQALIGTEDENLLPLLVKKYFSMKKNVSQINEKKILILSKYIYVLNKFLGIEGKGRMWVTHYQANFDKESKELEQHISNHFHNK